MFFATEVSPIRGTHRLLLIVETAGGSSGRAEISVGATIRLQRRKLFRTHNQRRRVLMASEA